jgi:hypothetical protein
MRIIHAIIAVAIGLATFSGSCFGAIVLNINPATEQLWFSGSDTGTFEDLGGGVWEAAWQFGSGLFGPSFDLNDPTNAFSPSPLSAQLDILDDGSNNLTGLSFFLAYNADPGSLEVTANPAITFSYSALDPGLVSDLNSLASGALVPTNPGLGWSNISIVQVPEPSSLAVAGILAGAVAVVALTRSPAVRSRVLHRHSSQRNA